MVWLLVWYLWFGCWLLLCFCLLGAKPWRAVSYNAYGIAPLLPALQGQLLFPRLCLEEPHTAGCCWQPVVWKKVSRRKVGCLANLVAESWSSPPRLRGYVRAENGVLTPVISPRGVEKATTSKVAPRDDGELHCLLRERLRIACIACSVRKVPNGIHRWEAGSTRFKACETTAEGCTFLDKKGV